MPCESQATERRCPGGVSERVFRKPCFEGGPLELQKLTVWTIGKIFQQPLGDACLARDGGTLLVFHRGEVATAKLLEGHLARREIHAAELALEVCQLPFGDDFVVVSSEAFFCLPPLLSNA